MMNLSIAINNFKITQNYEILPFRTYDSIDRELAEYYKNKILNIQKEKNISFFLALKYLLNELRNSNHKVYILIYIHGIEALSISLDVIKDLESFFIYTIYSCSGTEKCSNDNNIGIMFDDIKIEIIDGKINIVKKD